MKMNKWVEYDHPGECSSECSVGDGDARLATFAVVMFRVKVNFIKSVDVI